MTALAPLRVPELEALPGLEHGFGRRAPEPESRQAARARLAAELGAKGRLLLLSQVHGTRVLPAPWRGRPEADAGSVAVPGLLLGIETADCLPLLLVDPERRLAAAAHAGWRGSAAGIAAASVAALVALGSDPAALLAALGPCIGACCYEVGPELRGAFGPAADAVFRSGPRGREHLDLREANRRQLRAAGLAPERILGLEHCTACRPGEYHSYRRDGPGSGRMLSWAGWLE